MLKQLEKLSSFSMLEEYVVNKKYPVLTTGVIDTQKMQVVQFIKNKTNKNTLIITANEQKAKEIYDDLQYFDDANVFVYPAKDIIFYMADVKSIDIVKERCKVYEALLNNDGSTIIVPIQAMLDRITPRDIFEKYILNIKVADIVPIDEFVNNLSAMGFARREEVEYQGQYAVRGGIVDVFPTTLDTAVRIEFWGDEVDSIRLLDEFNERSVDKINEVKILPARELVYDEKTLKNAIKNITKEYEKTLDKFVKSGQHEEYETLRRTFSQTIEELELVHTTKNMDTFIPYFYSKKTSLLDYVTSDYNIYIDEEIRAREAVEFLMNEFDESIKNRLLKGYMLPSQTMIVNTLEEILASINKFDTVLMSSISTNIKDFKIESTVNFEIKLSPVFRDNVSQFVEDLKYYRNNQYTTIILVGSKARAKILASQLDKDGVPTTYCEDTDAQLQKGVVYISKGVISKGFVYPEIKLVVISDSDLFGKKSKPKKRGKKQGKVIESFLELKIGDYVVHENHGIGIFKGTEKITHDGISKDYIKLGYKDGGNLYIPTNQLDMIQKYIGGDGAKPKMHKLGGSDWNKSKSKAKKAVVILAQELVELYALREASTGYSYSPDTVWQSEFEEMFPYQETDDQLNSINDVKSDMEKSKVMDRLICGDVGYGKTEVAIRAAFKAVQDSKQVAYLVPTTILAQQHYNTFVQRMKDFPINIELLSRFRTPKQQRESIERIALGKSDILVGTHRILSKDVEFKDLGLVIVDEEQRFGVTHKEKLKTIKENVDVLTLTATPIPRTLHMSMTGIRDMSVIEEPPQERMPVQTYVTEYNEEFVREAINRELARGGQVFYLYNRVSGIERVANTVQELVPDANVTYAHGQMSERQLENVMKDFIDNVTNVLVCTTIIETGLDISNANTIIIDNADQMGLSQLYQLRGRVGRSNRSAFAYLMYKQDKVLKEVAEKRLQTIRDFTEFGSGFKVAMRDLEIRGAGSLLGEQQHGHLDTVGYEMYCKLLDQAVAELKGEKVEETIDTLIDIEVNAFISDKYIKNELQKIQVYKKIANIKNENDYGDVQEELVDRFGDLPKATNNLMEVAMLKVYAYDLGAVSVVQKGNSITITLKEVNKLNLDYLFEESKKASNNIKLKADKTPQVIIGIKGSVDVKALQEMILNMTV